MCQSQSSMNEKMNDIAVLYSFLISTRYVQTWELHSVKSQPVLLYAGHKVRHIAT